MGVLIKALLPFYDKNTYFIYFLYIPKATTGSKTQRSRNADYSHRYRLTDL